MNITILERGAGIYRLRLETRGEDHKRKFAYETVRGTKADAEARRDELMDVDRTRPASREGAQQRVGEYLEKWVGRREATRDVSASTALWYRTMLSRIRPIIGHIKLGEISPMMIEDAYIALMREKGPRGKALGSRSIRHIHARLVSAFNDAAAEGWMPAGIMDRVKAPKVTEHKESTFSQLDIEKVMRRVSNDPHMGPIIRFAIATGCRRGEICALKWEDVELDAGVVNIRRNAVKVGAKVVEKQPKTKSGRRAIKLPESMAAEMRLMHEFRISTYVFATRDGRRRDPTSVSDQVAAVMDKLGLGKFTLHDLRHAHATMLLGRKMPLKAVSQRLGHADVAITLRTYSHVMPHDDEALAAEINDLMGGNK
jgi:integrase